MLEPLAATLECLSLGGNKLRGNVPPGIAAFTQLRVLELSSMDLEGVSGLHAHMLPTFYDKIDVSVRPQATFRESLRGSAV